MKWSIQSHLPSSSSKSRTSKLLKLLLRNRGLSSKSQIDSFLNPPHPHSLTPSAFGIKSSALKKAITRIQQAISSHQTIIIYGDYDADGICATAVMWLTLNQLGAKALPFIPHRERHGYGLSLAGIQEIMTHPAYNFDPNNTLILTVDNGIVANPVADYLSDQNTDLIITDHHQTSATLPQAHSIIHSDQIAGCGVAWVLAKELSLNQPNIKVDDLLDLVAIGSVADLMPMIGINRSLVKHGLSALNRTQRIGLKALIQEAGVGDQTLNAYHIGYIIAPRINAMGRLEHGLDALRLLCTRNPDKARDLASLLSDTNKSRQDLTSDMTSLADELYQSLPDSDHHKVIIIDHEEFHEGVIGLIAGKLAETYTKPAIVISRGPEISKASARSVKQVNIIKLIRTAQEHLINAGGHPGAAGFTIATEKIEVFRQALITSAHSIADHLLEPSLEIDCDLEPSDLTLDLYHQLETLEPFGVGNPRPIFATTATITSLRLVGRDHQHLKLQLTSPSSTLTNSNPGMFNPGIASTSNHTIDAIGFNLSAVNSHLKTGDTINLAFYLDKNVWNGRTTPQMIIKDIQTYMH